MADRILLSRGTSPVKLTTGKSVKVPALKEQAYQVVDLSAPAGNAPADPAKLAKEGSDLVVRYPDGTQFTLGEFFTVCPGNACTLTLADGSTTGQVVTAGAIAAAGEGLGFWGWTGIVGGGLGLAAAAGGGGGGSGGTTNAAPTLTATVPTNAASAVRVDSNIVLTFSESVVAGTGDILISNGAGDLRAIPVTDITQVTVSGNIVTINPTANLQKSGRYTVTMLAGVLKDTGGEAFGGISGTSLAFNTEDPTGPTLLSSTPADGASAVTIGGNIVLNFSKIVVEGTGDIRVVNNDNPGDTRVIQVSDATQVTISGSTVTINPTVNLLSDSRYSVLIAAGVFKDTLSNPFDGILLNTELNFATQDLTAPTLTSSMPANAAVAVPVGNNIVLTFSETVRAGTGNILLVNSNDAGDTRTINVLDTSQVTFNASTVTINPANDLLPNGHYSVQMNSGVIKDAADNDFAAMGAMTLHFRTPDTIAPTLAALTPADNATAVLVGTNIVLSFDEAVSAGTGDIVISNGTDTRTISVTDATQVVFSDSIVTISPTANLQPNSHYNVQLGAGVIRDASGNSFAGLTTPLAFDFDTQDTLAPALSGSTPADNATAVLVGSNIVLTFSESVVAGSGDIVISNGAGDTRNISVTDASQVTFSGSTVTVNPTLDLQANSTYSVQMASGGIRDAAGNAFAGIANTTLDFATQDMQGPVLASSSPADNAAAVAVGGNITLTFSEAVMAGTGNIVISNGAGDTRSISVTDAAQVAFSGNTVTINPTADLQANSTYHVQMASNVIRDAAGNAFAGISNATTLNFDTPDTIVPVLSVSTPADNASAVLISGNLVLTFSEVVQAGSGNIVISSVEGDSRTISVTDSSQVTFSGNTVTINPTANLQSNSHYNVQLVSGVIRDASGNAFAGIADSGTLNFDTQDLVTPTLLSSTPADNSAGIAVGGNITLTFSEAVVAGSGSIVITNTGNSADTRTISVTDTAQVSFIGSTVTINPIANLAASSHYNVQMASGVIKDTAGNSYAGIASSTVLDFDTQDPNAPTLVGSTPADNATAVLVGASLVLTFSETVMAGSGNIVISNGAGDTRSISVTDSTQVTFSGSTVTINPTANLLGDSHYSVQMASGVVLDASGNPFAGITTAAGFDFQTQDVTAPTLNSSTPADNASAVLIGSNIVLMFSEAVMAGSGNIVISNGAGDTRTISVADSSQVSFSGNTVTVNPTAALQSNSTYNVQMASGVIRDLAGNAFAGITGSTALDFSTQDLLAPTLVSSSPLDNAGNVLASDNVVLTFNEAVVAGSGNIVISNGTDVRTISVADSSQVSISGNTVTINPTADLQLNSHYSVQMASGVIRDAAGNAFAGLTTATALDFDTAVPAVELSDIANGVGGFVINGESASDISGRSVSGVGDVNGDGLADLIVGAPGSDPAAGEYAGRVYLVFGRMGTDAVDLSAVAAGVGGFVLNGQAAADQSGWSVSGAGDVNGDGLADLIVDAGRSDPAAGTDAGRSYLVFGKTTTTEVDLSAVSAGAGGFVINGQAAGDVSASSVSSAGDVNGDGLTDLIVGAVYSNPVAGTDAGRSYLVLGKTTTSPVYLSAVAVGVGGFVINGQAICDWSGYSVSVAGDVNGDGLADLLVGAPESDPAAGSAAGRSYVVFGKTVTTAVDLSAVAMGAGGFVINGQAAGNSSGASVSSVGDVNGDGLADLIVGAPNSDHVGGADAGRSYVVFGKTSTTAVDLSALAVGAGGFVINGQAASHGSGYRVASAGDVNGDGLADLVVGAPQTFSTATDRAGHSYVVFGKTTTSAVSLSAVAAGVDGFVINGQASRDYSGSSVSSAGDVNGDGLADLIVGAPNSDPVAGADAGRSYVVFGSTTGAFAQTTVDQFGTTGADSFTDSGTAQTLVTGQGNDTLTATAASILYGGAGNDSFVINSAMITALKNPFGSGGNTTQLARIDGGTGIDTISLSGSNLTLDLTQIANQAASNPDGGSRIDSIERISLTGTGNNTLILAPNDVRDMAGMNLFNDGNGWNGLGAVVQRHQLVIDGNAGDALSVSGGWLDAGTVSSGGQTYHIYNQSSSASQLLVDTDITASIDVPPTLISSTPADNATGVLVGSNIVLTFSEAVVAGGGHIVISDGTDTRTIGVGDASQISFSGNLVTIDPAEDLLYSKNYSVQVNGGVIKDLTGNDYTGILTLSRLDFFTSAPPTALELSTIAAGRGGFVINAQASGDKAGIVSGAGDVNGDGLADLIVGSSDSDPAAGVNAGRSYVVFGKSGGATVDLSTVATGIDGFVINGQSSADYSGGSVSSAGDVNGDGLADLIVGAVLADSPAGVNAGRCYVVFGKSDGTEVNLSTVSVGGGGFAINGQSISDFSGMSVSGAGDVNGDGMADLIVGASNSDPIAGIEAGRSYVVFGKSGGSAVNLSTVSAGIGGFVINGQCAADASGGSVSSAGDVNGDGLADLIVGARNSDPAAGVEAGRSYVVFGKSSGSAVDLSAVSAGSGGFVINGQSAGDGSGVSVSGAGDVNGDGLADLIVGANNSDSVAGALAGRSYVIFGKSNSAAINLSSVAAGNGGFVINGQCAADFSGSSVSSAGDLNGDGLSDLIVGAKQADAEGRADAGRSYVIFGKSDGASIDLSSVSTGSGGFVINGQCAADFSGGSVAIAGDVSGDGLADLIVGASGSDRFAGVDAGQSYVVFGSTGSVFYTQTRVEMYGTPSADSFDDTGIARTMAAGQGDDTLTATAASILYAGAGNDLLNINATMITALQSAMGTGGNTSQLSRIDGGTGIDTLSLSGTNLTLDLTLIANQAASNPDGGSRIDSIEKIDLTGTGNNTVKLQLRDVLDMSSANVFTTTGRQQLLVTGNSGDTVDLADATGTTNWTQSGTASINSVTYNVWNHNAALATVYINPTLSVI